MAWDDTKATSGTLAATEWNEHVTDQKARIEKSNFTAAASLLTSTGASGVVELPVGTAGQVLSVATGATSLEWKTASGTGDMLASVYDPTSIGSDAFDMDNMVEGSTNLILTSAERSAITSNSAKVTNATHTGDVTGSGELTIASGAVDIAMLSATGTADNTTYLRGDNTWATPAGGSGATVVVEKFIMHGDILTGSFMPYTIPTDMNGLDLKEIRAFVNTLPTGADIIFNVYKNTADVDSPTSTDSMLTSDTGVSIGTGQSATNGLYQVGCSSSGSIVGTPGTTIDSGESTVATNDVITINISQVGSTLTGSNMSIELVFG